jgi:hypothetical protein
MADWYDKNRKMLLKNPATTEINKTIKFQNPDDFLGNNQIRTWSKKNGSRLEK